MPDTVEPAAGWQVGQRVTINREQVATVQKVTPSGRAVVNGRTFGADGVERSNADYYRRAKLEPLTPAIEAEMALVERGRVASRDAFKAVEDADKWLRQALGGWGRRVPDAADVEKAEKLTTAIRQALGEGT